MNISRHPAKKYSKKLLEILPEKHFQGGFSFYKQSARLHTSSLTVTRQAKHNVLRYSRKPIELSEVI
jgi:hypothetical protein